jgi:hypothetical protein
MGFKTHYKTLMRKNFLIWKKGIFGSACELITPIAFAYLLVWMNNSLPIDKHEE